MRLGSLSSVTGRPPVEGEGSTWGWNLLGFLPARYQSTKRAALLLIFDQELQCFVHVLCGYFNFRHVEYIKHGLKHMQLEFYIEGSEPGLKGTVHVESKEVGVYIPEAIFECLTDLIGLENHYLDEIVFEHVIAILTIGSSFFFLESWNWTVWISFYSCGDRHLPKTYHHCGRQPTLKIMSPGMLFLQNRWSSMHCKCDFNLELLWEASLTWFANQFLISR